MEDVPRHQLTDNRSTVHDRNCGLGQASEASDGPHAPAFVRRKAALGLTAPPATIRAVIEYAAEAAPAGIIRNTLQPLGSDGSQIQWQSH
jgi:hypothetical protein